ncbi:MAG: hypothetical protein HC934_04220, partial [Acaryochloridaceae cyanobacterium SU_2_1]|nr:hypothetical protein [Acaryochloridaceae cyanobacterium SU_2_1]
MHDSLDTRRPHPALQAALSTLDVTLESELALFRRYQSRADRPAPDDLDSTDLTPQSQLSLLPA